MKLMSYNCKICNPTIFNPDFQSKCRCCDKFVYKTVVIEKHAACGITEIPRRETK